jgi:signal transduction histidine kinase
LNRPLDASDPEQAVSSEHGLGIGLQIVRQIVEGHGGTVEVTSASNAGTSIAIRLPSSRFRRGAGE